MPACPGGNRSDCGARGDRQVASDRERLRCYVKICEVIRERLWAMGFDPSLRGCGFGEEAASELAAIPDLEALRMADEPITRGDLSDRGKRRSEFEAEIERIAAYFREGFQPDFANPSPVELLPFCVRGEKAAWD